ncbi:MAG: hypothetical protein KGZ97_06325 [Bacteroidetes bacterium]|nr:hypothetical protein [Bacteroidota bacterium]
MHAYRFLIRFEELSDFSREIDVLADQTFEDFYNALATNLKLEDSKYVVFYICDHNFRKKTEIPREEAFASPKKKVNNDDDNTSTDNAKIILMKNAYLNEYIDDPHQRLIIVYDKISQWTFYIEMTKILQAQDKVKYPAIIKSEGETPRELVPIKIIAPVIEDNDDSVFVDEDSDDVDDGTSYNNEDIAEMETDESGVVEVEDEPSEEEVDEPDFSEDFSEDFDEEKF